MWQAVLVVVPAGLGAGWIVRLLLHCRDGFDTTAAGPALTLARTASSRSDTVGDLHYADPMWTTLFDAAR